MSSDEDQSVRAISTTEAAADPVTHDQLTRTTTSRGVTPDAMVAGVVGLVALIIGLIVVVRAGLHAPLSQPVVEVLGFTHTATLGLIEVAAGLFLVVAASARSRGAEAFGGLVLLVGGAVGVAQYGSFADTLALERSWAWIVLVAGVVVTVAALVLPRTATRSTSVRQRAS